MGIFSRKDKYIFKDYFGDPYKKYIKGNEELYTLLEGTYVSKVGAIAIALLLDMEIKNEQNKTIIYDPYTNKQFEIVYKIKRDAIEGEQIAEEQINLKQVLAGLHEALSEISTNPNIKELAVFGVLGAMIFASKIVMDFLPNIHIIGALLISITAVYRIKGIYPLSVFVFLTGLLNGFPFWWIPYLYIWFPLVFLTLLIPENTSSKIAIPLYILINAIHGFTYGILYAPSQALLFGLDFEGTISWIIAGFPFDLIHGISNAICGILIFPMILALKTAKKYVH